MKKTLFSLLLVMVVAVPMRAQFTHFGIRAGVGFATHIDDLATNSPIMSANLGGYVAYGFTESQSLLAENFTIQAGLNLIRRGCGFTEILEDAMSIREGTYSAWYAQIPIQAAFRYELPIREPGHFALLNVGPAINVGLFGSFNDRKITRGLPQDDWNYKRSTPVFDELNRIDASFLLGVGYEHQDLSFMLQMDLGLMAVSQTPDALDINPETGVSNHMVSLGNNFALLLTVGYRLPIR